MSQQVSYRNFSGTAAENYQRYFVPAIAAPVSSDLLHLADLRPGERVVDVACGTGVVARQAAERVAPAGTVVGVDVAADMIEVARATPASGGVDVDWREGDAAALPLPDDSFDVALCQMGLMFVEDKPTALSEIRRVLAPGGRLVLNTPGTIQPVFEVMDEALVRHISPDLAGFVRAVFSMDDPAVLETLLVEAGFQDVVAKSTTTTLRLPAPADFLWQYINLTPMGAFVSQAPEEAQTALERDVVGQWEEFVVDGATVVDQPVVLATGRA